MKVFKKSIIACVAVMTACLMPIGASADASSFVISSPSSTTEVPETNPDYMLYRTNIGSTDCKFVVSAYRTDDTVHFRWSYNKTVYQDCTMFVEYLDRNKNLIEGCNYKVADRNIKPLRFKDADPRYIHVTVYNSPSSPLKGVVAEGMSLIFDHYDTYQSNIYKSSGLEVTAYRQDSTYYVDWSAIQKYDNCSISVEFKDRDGKVLQRSKRKMLPTDVTKTPIQASGTKHPTIAYATVSILRRSGKIAYTRDLQFGVTDTLTDFPNIELLEGLNVSAEMKSNGLHVKYVAAEASIGYKLSIRLTDSNGKPHTYTVKVKDASKEVILDNAEGVNQLRVNIFDTAGNLVAYNRVVSVADNITPIVVCY